MPAYFACLTIVLMIGIVFSRVLILKRKGAAAMQFGKIDRTDFLIPPFALFYFYLVFAAAFHLPTLSRQVFFHSGLVAWAGVFLCLTGLTLLLWSIVSFGPSFRVGIDTDVPGKLVTSGAFALSRNPVYIALTLILLGQFLVFSNWILLVFTGAALWLFHRQVLREEYFLSKHYGKEFAEYRNRVGRYL